MWVSSLYTARTTAENGVWHLDAPTSSSDPQLHNEDDTSFGRSEERKRAIEIVAGEELTPLRLLNQVEIAPSHHGVGKPFSGGGRHPDEISISAWQRGQSTETLHDSRSLTMIKI